MAYENKEGGLNYLVDTFQFPAFGERDFYCIGDGVEQTFVVPVGVTSISAVLIAGGSGGQCGGNQRQSRGGGGGGLRYINGLPVVPGEVLKICVGCGGTEVRGTYAETLPAQNQPAAAHPGENSYISSTNNNNVPQRVGIGNTIIIFAQGGGQFETTFLDPNGSSRTCSAGGTGTVPGSYSWGTVGGGDGGFGGPESNKGGARDGGGGGAGGWTGNGGNGAYAGEKGSEPNIDPTAGSGGGGGGGMYTSGGGGNGGGGGGGTGVIWGSGTNGNSAQGSTAVISGNEFFGWCGQGGSYGADGLATGNETFGPTEYSLMTGAGPNGLIPTPYNYRNGSIGNGVRGYIGSEDDAVGGVRPPREGGGGYFGGGGGGADTSGSETANSGSGGDGVIRIIYAARFNRSRNYPSPNNANNVLSNYGYPFNPPANGGPRLDGSPNIVGSTLPYPNSGSATY